MRVPHTILKDADEALRRFSLVSPGDRVAVGVSGGKDSLLLALTLLQLGRRPDWAFDVQCVHLDQHQPGFDRETFESTMAALELPVTVVSKDTWSVVSSKLQPGQIPCALCSRMRRGVLNDWCREQGVTKLALGHHLDDAIATFFLNLFYQRQLEPLKPATPTDDGAVTTVRPLILVEEQRIIDWVAREGIAPVGCPVCDDYPASKRRDVGEMVAQMKAMHPDLAASVRGALYSA